MQYLLQIIEVKAKMQGYRFAFIIDRSIIRYYKENVMEILKKKVGYTVIHTTILTVYIENNKMNHNEKFSPQYKSNKKEY